MRIAMLTDHAADISTDCPFAPMSTPKPISIDRRFRWTDRHVFTLLPSDTFDILVPALSVNYAAAVEEAFHNGQLDGCKLEGLLWVAESDLFELAGPGRDPDDPEGGCFIPHEARKRNIAREQRRRKRLAVPTP